MSVCIWMKFLVATSGNWKGILSTQRSEGLTNGFAIFEYTSTGLNIGFAVRDATRRKFIKVAVSHPSVGDWGHYVFTMLPTGGIPDFTVYIDGQVVSGIVPTEGSKSSNNRDCDEIIIGRYYAEVAGYKSNHVIIDEFSIFEYILENSRALVLYNGAL